jgi:hypothetical protein
MPTAQQGHNFVAGYYHEDNGFANLPTDSTLKTPGANHTIDQAEGSNQAVQVFQPGSRAPVDIVEQLFNGAWQMSFVYTNPWWLNFIYGAPSTVDNNDGSYTHTWDGEDPQSQQIVIGREASGEERVLKGCVCTQATFAPQVNGMTQITLTGAYAEEETLDPASIISQPTLDKKPITFADTSLDLGGTTLGYVQSGQMQLQNNIDLVSELGTRVPIDYAPRTLVPSFNFSKINELGETDNLQKMYGDSASTTVQEDVTSQEGMTFVFDNGKSAGSGINRMTADLKGTFPESYGENGLGDPEADVTEEINRLVETVSIDATNETSTAV